MFSFITQDKEWVDENCILNSDESLLHNYYLFVKDGVNQRMYDEDINIVVFESVLRDGFLYFRDAYGAESFLHICFIKQFFTEETHPQYFI